MLSRAHLAVATVSSPFPARREPAACGALLAVLMSRSNEGFATHYAMRWAKGTSLWMGWGMVWGPITHWMGLVRRAKGDGSY